MHYGRRGIPPACHLCRLRSSASIMPIPRANSSRSRLLLCCCSGDATSFLVHAMRWYQPISLGFVTRSQSAPSSDMHRSSGTHGSSPKRNRHRRSKDRANAPDSPEHCIVEPTSAPQFADHGPVQPLLRAKRRSRSRCCCFDALRKESIVPPPRVG